MSLGASGLAMQTPESRGPDERVAIFLHSGAYDRIHQGLAIAAAAAAVGRPVQIYFFWWALDRLVRGDLHEPTFDEPGVPQATLEAAEDAIEGGYPSAAQLLEVIRGSETCELLACSASARLVGQRPDVVASHVDRVVGWSAILALTAGISDRFYL